MICTSDDPSFWTALFYLSYFPVVRPMGFEPITSCLSDMRSNQMSYGRKLVPPVGNAPTSPGFQAGANLSQLRWDADAARSTN